MLLRIGVIAISFSVILALVLGAISLLRDKPEEVAAAKSAAASPESTTEQTYQDPRDKMLDLPSPKPKPEPETTSQPESQPQPVSQPEPEPDPKPEPAPQPEPEPQPQSSLPVAGADWPAPDDNEVQQANEPRHYDWVPGAVLTLTVNSIGLHNAPVMGNDSQQALENGVVHVPETSLPWTRSPQRNVYLAGHRLGWPGTGSRLIFHNLDRLGKGDEVLLKDRQGNSYRYKVTEKFAARPGDRWVMGQVRNRDMVTLQTCTGPNFSKRLIVRADRV